MNAQATLVLTKKLSRTLGVGWILVGALFLFDPYFSALDLLPDCLGYLFFALGLYRLSDLDARLAESAKGARRLALMGVARIAATVFSFGFVSPVEQPVFILLTAFILAVIDCILFIPMWKNFSAGLIYLGSPKDGRAVFTRKGSRRSVTEIYAAFSGVYFVLREALAVLPELTVLTDEKGGAESVGGQNLYEFIGLLRGLCVIASLTLGIIWLVCTVIYVARLLSDKPFFANLKARYESDVLTRPDLFAMRAVGLSMGCLIAAAVLSVDLYLDGYNMIPDLLPAILMILALFFLRRFAGKNILIMLVTSLYGGCAAVTWLLQFFTINLKQMGEVNGDPELQAGFEIMTAMQLLTGILFCVSFILILRALFSMVKKYTGVRIFRLGSDYAAERTEAIHSVIRGKLITVGVFAVLTALSTVYQWVGISIMPSLRELFGTDMELLNNFTRTVVITVYQIMTEGYWFIDLALGVGLVGFLVSATSEISEQMEYSYMMKE